MFDSKVSWKVFEAKFMQFASENNRLLYYWPIIHDLISKIYPKFQVLTFHFSEVDDLLD